MIQSKIVFNSQVIHCNAVLDEAGHYSATLHEKIKDPVALDFWSRFEEAVNGIMLSLVDQLQNELSSKDYFVIQNGTRYSAHAVDLQIYPSTLKASWKFS